MKIRKWKPLHFLCKSCLILPTSSRIMADRKSVVKNADMSEDRVKKGETSLLVGTSRENVRCTPYFVYKFFYFNWIEIVVH